MINQDDSEEAVRSPCVRNCCLDEDDFCIGCYRHINEITAWHSLSVQEKQNTLKQCQQRKQDRQSKG